MTSAFLHSRMGARANLCRVLFLVTCLAQRSTGQMSDKSSSPSDPNTTEEAVQVKDVMSAMERHFELLSSRILALENTVSSLQFYSIRQFNQISGSLQSTNNDLGTVRKQVSLLEIDGRSHKIALSLVSRDLSDLRKISSDMLGEMESSFVSVHESMDKHSDLIKTVVEDTVFKAARETAAQVSEMVEDVVMKSSALQAEPPVNCTTGTAVVLDHLDHRFQDFKKQTQAQLVKLINAAKADLKRSFPSREQLLDTVSVREMNRDHSSNCTNVADKVNGRPPPSTTSLGQKIKEILTTTTKTVTALGNLFGPLTPTSEIPGGRTTTTQNSIEAKHGLASVYDEVEKATQTTTTENYKSVLSVESEARKRAGERVSVSSSTFMGVADTTTPERSVDESTTIQDREEELTLVTSTTTPEDSSFLLTATTEAAGSTILETAAVQETLTSVQAKSSIVSEEDPDEMVMNALYKMTDSVLQAVSYFRHTGRTLELILSNTEKLVYQQSDGQQRTEFLKLEDQGWPNDHNFSAEFVSSVAGKEHPALVKVPPGHIPASEGCSVSMDVAANVANVIKNGSQLLEVLTDLAQVSSSLLVSTTATLQDQVQYLEDARKQLNLKLTGPTPEMGTPAHEELVSASQRTFKLLEAVASGSSLLPVIFHHLQNLETVTNRSLKIDLQSQDMLRQVLSSLSNGDFPDVGGDIRGENEAIFNRIPLTLGLEESFPHPVVEIPWTRPEGLASREIAEVFYNVTLLMSRVLPAVKSFVDPLVILVDGETADRGRVEIFTRGVWGTLCHQNISHIEADLLCRHLGYPGGVSAGAGHYGTGSGPMWSLNASCLTTGSNCTAFSPLGSNSTCGHSMDSAVICDEMIRITVHRPKGKVTEGVVQIHHRDKWLPVCGTSWTDNSARVACWQMGFSGGHKLDLVKQRSTLNYPGTTGWLGKTTCLGSEARLTQCPNEGWTDRCPGQSPAGVTCL